MKFYWQQTAEEQEVCCKKKLIAEICSLINSEQINRLSVCK